MTAKIQFLDGIGEVRYLKRKGQRAIRISLKADHVRVSMPYFTPMSVAKAFVMQKRDWIIAHHKPQQEFYDGMHIGKFHRLKIDDNLKRSNVKANVIKAPNDQAKIKQSILRALKIEADTLLTNRVQQLANQSKLEYSELKFRHMKGRWGSCSSQGVLTFSTLLIQLPWHLIDYVIYHELSHLKHLDHSTQFWTQMQLICPDFKQRRKQLKKYRPVIFTTMIS